MLIADTGPLVAMLNAKDRHQEIIGHYYAFSWGVVMLSLWMADSVS